MRKKSSKNKSKRTSQSKRQSKGEGVNEHEIERTGDKRTRVDELTSRRLKEHSNIFCFSSKRAAEEVTGQKHIYIYTC